MKKINTIVLIVSFLICFFCIIFCIFVVNKDLVTKVKSKYKKYVVLSKNTKLYDKNKRIIGKMTKELTISLSTKKITSYKDKFLKIKNYKYYIDYNDIIDKKITDNNKNNYIQFNKNVITKDNPIFYKNNQKALELKEKINLPLIYSDDNYYYVKILNNILGLKKEDCTLINKKNTSRKETEKISIIKYNKIYDKKNEECNENTCIEKEQIQEQFNYLKLKKYYTINLDEYKLWLKGKIRLKQKAVLLIVENNYDKNIVKNYNYVINNIKDIKKINFIENNQPTTKKNSLDMLYTYLIKKDTKLIEFVKILKNEQL